MGSFSLKERFGQFCDSVKAKWEELNQPLPPRSLAVSPEMSEKDRAIQVRDTLRFAWDRLHDTRNGFGVHSPVGAYRYRAQQEAVDLAKSLAVAEENARHFDDLG